MNFAVFRSALERGERLGAGPILKAWRGLLVFASRWFQIDSLYRFNAKFRPIWEPRFVCYPNGRDLPRIAIAMLEAEAFIVWPRPQPAAHRACRPPVLRAGAVAGWFRRRRPACSGFQPAGRTLVMGVINVTPDSFSDGGVYADPQEAIGAGVAMLAEGADLIDVGGESTRPGAARISPQEELRRILPVVDRTGGGGRAGERRHEPGRSRGCRAGCRRLPGQRRHRRRRSGDVCAGRAAAGAVRPDARTRARASTCRSGHTTPTWSPRSAPSSQQRLQAAQLAGIAADALILDPGIGFAKNAEHNWALLASLDRLEQLGRPLLVGTSRKSFLGALLPDAAGHPRPVDRRDAATVATTALAAAHGAWAVRVHAVRASADAVRVAAAWRSVRAQVTGVSANAGPHG